MGAVDAPCDPLLHQETFKVRRVVLQVDRRRLEHHDCIRFDIHCQVDMASAAAVQFPDDLVAVEDRPRLEKRRKRQLGQLPVDRAGTRIRQRINPDHLAGQIVLAASLQRFFDDEPGSPVEIVPAALDRRQYELRSDMFVDAIRGKQEDVSFFQVDRTVIDLEMSVDAERAAQVALLRRYPEPMVAGDLLERIPMHLVDPRIAHMENMRPRRHENHRAQSAHIARYSENDDFLIAGSGGYLRPACSGQIPTQTVRFSTRTG